MSADEGLEIDLRRFARSLTLIAFVTAAFLLTSANVLPGDLLPIAVVAIGSIALVTAITTFLVAAGAVYDEPEAHGGRSAEDLDDPGPAANPEAGGSEE